MSLPTNTDAKLWLALLHEVSQAGGSATPKDVIDKMQAYFPEITPDDLTLTTKHGESLLRNRVRWARQQLIDRGCLVNQKFVWAITPAGTQWLDSNWKGPGADYSKVVKPTPLKVAPPVPPHPSPPPKPGNGGHLPVVTWAFLRNQPQRQAQLS